MYQNYSSIVINIVSLTNYFMIMKFQFNCIFTILSCSFVVKPTFKIGTLPWNLFFAQKSLTM